MDFSPYAEFFNHEWDGLLDSVPADWSWDRKACYLYLTATQGNTIMAKGTRGRKPSQNQQAAMLVSALDFLSAAPDKKDNPNNIVINGPMISVNNGLLKAGIALGDGFPADVVAKVQMSPLIGALARVTKEMELTFGDEFVTIKSTDFVAELANLTISLDGDRVNPDALIAPLTNEFREALTKVARLVSDSGDELLISCIAVTGTTVVATKRHTLIEAWHGNDMPYGMLFLPKAFALALGKVKADITGFGFSPSTFTVHFANGAFLQTNTYQNAWAIEGQPADYAFTIAQRMLTDGDGAMINPEGLVDNMKTIMAVTGADIHVSLGRMQSVDGAVDLTIPGQYETFVIAGDRYVAIADLITTLKLVKSDLYRLLFWGDKVRGCVLVDPEAALSPAEAPAPAAAPTGWTPPPANPTPAPSGAPASAGVRMAMPAPEAAPAPSGWGVAGNAASPTSPPSSQALAPATSTGPAPSAAPGWGNLAGTPIPPASTASPSSFPPSGGSLGFGDDD